MKLTPKELRLHPTKRTHSCSADSGTLILANWRSIRGPCWL